MIFIEKKIYFWNLFLKTGEKRIIDDPEGLVKSLRELFKKDEKKAGDENLDDNEAKLRRVKTSTKE